MVTDVPNACINDCNKYAFNLKGNDRISYVNETEMDYKGYGYGIDLIEFVGHETSNTREKMNCVGLKVNFQNKIFYKNIF